MAEARELEAESAVSAFSATVQPVEIVDAPTAEDIEVIGRREEPPPPPPPPQAVSPRWSFGQGVATRSTVHQLPAPSLGPVGQKRKPMAVMALVLLSLGAYSVAWHRRVNREMADFDARLEVSPGASALAIFLSWFAGLASTLTGVAIIAGHYLHVGPQIPLIVGVILAGGLLAGPYLTLLVPPALVATVMTLERLRLVQERVGMRTDRQVRPVARLTVLLLPLLGGLWHVAATQSKLNNVWHESRLASLPEPPPIASSD